ncbi:unnamed protein product [Aphanomyces euteiches]|nr:hypothetical protein Ae201684P_004884 [Aphanomyces euteiches]KAH9134235.1 hypothetical protein AeRB84_019950 [Aphanomyces euteiches]
MSLLILMIMVHNGGLLLHVMAVQPFRHKGLAKDQYREELREIKAILKELGQQHQRKWFQKRIEPPVPTVDAYLTTKVKVSGVRIPFSSKMARQYKTRIYRLPTIQESA